MADIVNNIKNVIETDTGESVKELEKYSKAAEDATDETADFTGATEAFNSQLGNMLSSLGIAPARIKAVTAATGGLTRGMNFLRTAIIGTGIGALVIALAGLVALFTQNQEAVDSLTKVFDQVKAVIDVVIGRFVDIGKAIVNFGSAIVKVFKGDFAGAADAAREGVEGLAGAFTGLGKEIRGATRDAAALADATIALEIAEVKLEAQINRNRNAIAQLRIEANDSTLSNEKRLESATRAREIEEENGLIALELQAQRIQLIKDEIAATPEQTRGRKEHLELLKAESELDNIKAASAQRIRSIRTREAGLINAVAVEQDRLNKALRDEAEIQARRAVAVPKALDKIGDAMLSNQVATIDLTNVIKVQNVERLTEEAIDNATASAAILNARLKAEANEEAQEVIDSFFASNKAGAFANTLINTAEAIGAALKLPFPLNIAQVALVTGVGAAQAATIARSFIRGGSFAESCIIQGGGGMINGRRHASGGVRFGFNEAEGGEFIINRGATKNFLPLLKAINDTGRTGAGAPGFFQQGGAVEAATQLESALIMAIQSAPPVLVIEDLNRVQNNIDVRERATTL